MGDMQDGATVRPESNGYQLDPGGWSDQKDEMRRNQELVLNQADYVVEEIKKRLEVLEDEATAMVEEYSEMRTLNDEAYKELHRYYCWVANTKDTISDKTLPETLHDKFCQVIKCLSHETSRKSCNMGAFTDAASRNKEETAVGLVQLLQKDSKQSNIMTRENTIKMIEHDWAV